MKTINEILTSGIITNVKFGQTVQTRDSNVYSFRFETTDEDGHWSINGYVQTTNTDKNAIINGDPIHAFDCFITEYTMKDQIEKYLRSLIEMNFEWNEIFEITNHKNDEEVDRLVRQFDHNWDRCPSDADALISKYTSWILDAVK